MDSAPATGEGFVAVAAAEAALGVGEDEAEGKGGVGTEGGAKHSSFASTLPRST